MLAAEEWRASPKSSPSMRKRRPASSAIQHRRRVPDISTAFRCSSGLLCLRARFFPESRVCAIAFAQTNSAFDFSFGAAEPLSTFSSRGIVRSGVAVPQSLDRQHFHSSSLWSPVHRLAGRLLLTSIVQRAGIFLPAALRKAPLQIAQWWLKLCPLFPIGSPRKLPSTGPRPSADRSFPPVA